MSLPFKKYETFVHMSKITPNTDSTHYYLPHHGATGRYYYKTKSCFLMHRLVQILEFFVMIISFSRTRRHMLPTHYVKKFLLIV